MIFNPDYIKRIELRSTQLNCDGCTKVTEWNRICCLHHDIMYRTGMDIDGNPVTKEIADVLFYECNRIRAWLGLSWYDPFSYARYLGVKIHLWWITK